MTTKHSNSPAIAPAPTSGITEADVRRIQSATAKQNKGKVAPGSHVARMQRAVARKSSS